jgi:3-oxoacyl-[acyl-carrier-protein] synthase-3
MSSVLRSDGAGWDLLGVPTIGSLDAYLPARADQIDDTSARPAYEMHRLHMNGNEVYRFATRVVSESIKQALEKAKLTVEDIGMIVPHQANQRILDQIAKQLKIPVEKVFSNVAKYGNTSAATVPIALTEAVEQGLIQTGDHVVMTGFGGGLTWATMVIRWEAQSADFSKVMDFRRRAIYWYALRRRGLVKLWRRVTRILWPDPDQGSVLSRRPSARREE